MGITGIHVYSDSANNNLNTIKPLIGNGAILTILIRQVISYLYKILKILRFLDLLFQLLIF